MEQDMKLEHTEDPSLGESKLGCHSGCCYNSEQPHPHCLSLLQHSCEPMVVPEVALGPLKSTNVLLPYKDLLIDKRPKIVMNKLGRMKNNAPKCISS